MEITFEVLAKKIQEKYGEHIKIVWLGKSNGDIYDFLIHTSEKSLVTVRIREHRKIINSVSYNEYFINDYNKIEKCEESYYLTKDDKFYTQFIGEKINIF